MLNLYSIVLTIQGKDAEYWGGFYGPQFSEERLYIEVDQASAVDKSILKRFGNKGIKRDDVSTFFNLGFGNTYFIDGKELEKKGQWNNY